MDMGSLRSFIELAGRGFTALGQAGEDQALFNKTGLTRAQFEQLQQEELTNNRIRVDQDRVQDEQTLNNAQLEGLSKRLGLKDIAAEQMATVGGFDPEIASMVPGMENHPGQMIPMNVPSEMSPSDIAGMAPSTQPFMQQQDGESKARKNEAALEDAKKNDGQVAFLGDTDAHDDNALRRTRQRLATEFDADRSEKSPGGVSETGMGGRDMQHVDIVSKMAQAKHAALVAKRSGEKLDLFSKFYNADTDASQAYKTGLEAEATPERLAADAKQQKLQAASTQSLIESRGEQGPDASPAARARTRGGAGFGFVKAAEASAKNIAQETATFLQDNSGLIDPQEQEQFSQAQAGKAGAAIVKAFNQQFGDVLRSAGEGEPLSPDGSQAIMLLVQILQEQTNLGFEQWPQEVQMALKMTLMREQNKQNGQP